MDQATCTGAGKLARTISVIVMNQSTQPLDAHEDRGSRQEEPGARDIRKLEP